MLQCYDGIFLCFCAVIHFICRYRPSRRFPLPPGLPRWPILGNALSIPLTYAHVFYKDLGDRLGAKFMYLEALGRPLIIINDFGVAQDLLEKRSALYSSRPQIPMLTNVIGIRHLFSIMPYGDEWRNHRRIFQQHFSTKNLRRDQEKELEFVRKGLLQNILATPQDFDAHVRSCIGGLAISMAYGLPVKSREDPLVRLAEQAFADMAGAAAPGKYLVNVISPLQYVPDWMPGAGFKEAARNIRRQLLRLLEEPYKAALTTMDEGTNPECFVSESLERHRDRPDFEAQASDIKKAAMQIFAAAYETTSSAAMTFVLAMLKYPDVQQQAQLEIDSVVGHDRLPDFSDLPSLPYLSAVVKEVIRWNPVVPLGVPHMTSDEDVYEGYYIPKDCIVLTNIYAMLHDEKVFPNPKKFNPERFFRDGILVDSAPDPEVFASFGFGRRACPGSHIALSTLYIIAASVLCLFDVSPAVNAEGEPIGVIPEFTPASITSAPLPFKCKLAPREGKDVGTLLKAYPDVECI